MVPIGKSYSASRSTWETGAGFSTENFVTNVSLAGRVALPCVLLAYATDVLNLQPHNVELIYIINLEVVRGAEKCLFSKRGFDSFLPLLSMN